MRIGQFNQENIQNMIHNYTYSTDNAGSKERGTSEYPCSERRWYNGDLKFMKNKSYEYYTYL